MNGVRIFVDTNVFLYKLDAASPEKQARAERWIGSLWQSRSGRTSWQVIQEFYADATGKFRIGSEDARTVARAMLEWEPFVPDAEALTRAWRWSDAAQLSFWDAMIVAAAERCDCDYLLSEDFQAGRQFGVVRVVNPFSTAPGDLGA